MNSGCWRFLWVVSERADSHSADVGSYVIGRSRQAQSGRYADSGVPFNLDTGRELETHSACFRGANPGAVQKSKRSRENAPQ
jgi:hypothetical protein